MSVNCFVEHPNGMSQWWKIPFSKSFRYVRWHHPQCWVSTAPKAYRGSLSLFPSSAPCPHQSLSSCWILHTQRCQICMLQHLQWTSNTSLFIYFLLSFIWISTFLLCYRICGKQVQNQELQKWRNSSLDKSQLKSKFPSLLVQPQMELSGTKSCNSKCTL